MPHAALPRSAGALSAVGRLPLCVDLDGTLLRSDLLVESALRYLIGNPLRIVAIFWWLVIGKARLKRELARRVSIDVATLPYHSETLSFLSAEREAGRPLYLCTASDREYADLVAAHLGLFAGVIATEGQTNLSGTAKARRLVERFGSKGFAYIGDSSKDIPVWHEAGEAIAVVQSKRRESYLTSHVKFSTLIRPGAARPMTFLRALRVHQWVKNLLLLAPVVMAHQVRDLTVLVQCLLGMVSFSCVASAVYILNDLVDLDSDRVHRSKCKRPFASGELPLLWGAFLVPALLLCGAVAAASLPSSFATVMLLYLVVTSGYSLWGKRVAIFDVLCLAGLYTLRVFAGGSATGIVVSQWLLAFCLFFFYSLACLKRVSELIGISAAGKTVAPGRGYSASDAPYVGMMGVGSGYLSILVLALYVSSADVTRLYADPQFVWFLCPVLLFWVSRIWLLGFRGQIHDDPVVFAIRDWGSYVCGLLVAAILFVAH